MIKLSVIIPCRNEGSNIAHTFHSITHCLEADGFRPSEFEIIIVDNCSAEYKYPQRGTEGINYMMTRGAYWNRVLRVLYDPIAGNHSARNKGAKIAMGEYFFFSDGHMAYRPGFFKSILKTVDDYGGIVHGALQFMGAYPPVQSSMGYQYTLKLGDECKMTWNNYFLTDTPWYIEGQGAWGVACKRDEFFRLGGWEDPHRCYGGEFYFELKAWMLGSTVMVDPNAVGYHLAQGRGYAYNHLNYVENILGLLYALGADDWRERAYINYLRSKNKKSLDEIMARGEKEYAANRKWIEENRKYTFNQLLTERPWEKMNMAKFGRSNCSMTMFHYSALELFRDNPIAKEAYLNSKYQQQLGEFIETQLHPYIYKHPFFLKKYGEEGLLKLRREL